MSYVNLNNVPTQAAGSSEVLASDWNTYVRDNFDALKYGHLVCTSSTRPASVAEGTMIYETDTNKLMRFDGSGWVELVASGDDFSSSLAGYLGLSQTGSTRRVSASYATEATTTSTSNVLTGLSGVTLATAGAGFVRGLLTADMKNSNASYSARANLTTLDGATTVFSAGVATSYQVSNYIHTHTSNMFVLDTSYRKAAFYFEFCPTYFSSGTTTTFNVYFSSQNAAGTAYIKDINLYAVWNSF